MNLSQLNLSARKWAFAGGPAYRGGQDNFSVSVLPRIYVLHPGLSRFAAGRQGVDYAI